MPSLRARTLRLASQKSPQLKAALLEAVRTASSYSLYDKVEALVFAQAREAGLKVDDFSTPGPGTFTITVVDDVTNPAEPGESQTIEYRIFLSFLTGKAIVRAGNKVLHEGSVSLDKLWNYGLGSILMELSRYAPKPSFSREDSPSLRESHPWAYEER